MIEQLARPDVDYVSVKISAVCAQLDVARVRRTRSSASCERLRRLYAAARAARPARSSSTSTWRSTATSHLTVAAFQRVPRRARRSARSMPASSCRPTCRTPTPCSTSSATWAARRRRAAGGGRSRCASSRAPTWRWSTSRPSCTAGRRRRTPTKAEVDANYKRAARLVARPRAATARVRSASPATTCSTWPGRCAARERARRATDRVEIEMLEGMADRRRPRAVRRAAGGVLLYAPVVRADDFDARGRLPGPPPRREHRAARTSCATCST